MTFQLDTSGTVAAYLWRPLQGCRQHIRWSDLSPLTQGYIEALLADALPLYNIATPPRFSSLPPETLARIIADCEAFQQKPAYGDLQHSTLHEDEERNAGAEFYHVRQRMEDHCHGFKVNDWPPMTAEPCNVAARAFPPLTVQLGDDGKVRFAA